MDWLGVILLGSFFLLLFFFIWLICRGCSREDVFLTLQMMKLPEQNDPSGWYEAGKLLMKKGKYRKALICFEEVFKYDPHYQDLEDYIQTCNEKLFRDFEGW